MRVFFVLVTRHFQSGWIVFFIFCMLSPGLAAGRFVPDVRIEHAPSTTLARGERIHLDARIVGSEKLTEIRCYFKYEAANPYLFVKMKPTGEGFECWLPAPANHVDRIEYVFVAVDSQSQVVRSSVFYASISSVPTDRAKPTILQKGTITVKSELPISNQAADAFASTDRPVYTIVAANKQFGRRAEIYDSAQDPGYRYGIVDGLAIGLNTQYLSPTLGYQSFSAAVSSDVQILIEQEILAQNYPDIDGTDWSGYFYVVDNHGNFLSDKSPLNAAVHHDGNGNVSMSISTHKCPGQDYYSHGTMDTSGFIYIYDDCDDELWTTHWEIATSTHIQIMDFIDPPYYKTLNVVDITRSNPATTLAAPVQVAPSDGAVTDIRATVLEWKAAESAVNYQVRLGSTCNAGTIYETPSLKYTLSNIEPNTLYYWQVRGQNSYAQWGLWSPCWSFTAQIPCLSCPAVNFLLLGE